MNTRINQASVAYGIAHEQISTCKYCQEKIFWQASFRTGGSYATNVKESDGSILPLGTFITARNWFHNCARPTQQSTLFPQPVVTPALYNPTGTSMAARVRAMREFVEKATPMQLRQALRVIFNRQTLTEQRADMTSEDNGIGFGGTDAEICSNIYKSAEKYGGLKGKQVDLIRRKMKKYSRQLVNALEAGEWTI
jgi:hypothetical protein